MRLQAWQVGLDIQAGFARAIAVQRRRHGWQLRHWWQHPLPDFTLREGILHESAPLIAILSCWRKTLPALISLRISLPAQRIMQQRLAVPDSRLREPARSAFIFASAAKQFPLSIEHLVMDYRADPHGDNQIVVTAARQQEIEQWIACMAQARLFPDIIELAPCALHVAAHAAGLPGDALLVHPMDDAFLWASPHSLPFQFGLFSHGEIETESSLLEKVRAQYRAASLCSRDVFFSGESPQPLMQNWSPLSAIGQLSAPLPANPGAFAPAVGLALRQADY
ncbi:MULTISPECIES: pilus assembly protein PilM [Rahnella]|jgi:pilus assembly protein HofM|uniref:Pilus assembly protein PilM n=1 Tax=Rahnella contaminans TaxID=2703882 RepID=A0A6M2B8W1_9GAMM|nr:MULTISPECIES: pilus assembly protein PilM [Rahnella]KAB8305961.1 pilus assembly protein HofM [Rouxiella chamberiensis]MBU9822155.1 pilus assembly protein PilM [Rahnella sp. BCC 1045]NGX89112.1 pilus assembly protein PilM [Rahnella contaminans]